MTDDNGAIPSAGWYEDPDHPGVERYWDGAAWTDDVRPPPTSAPPPPAAEKSSAVDSLESLQWTDQIPELLHMRTFLKKHVDNKVAASGVYEAMKKKITPML